MTLSNNLQDAENVSQKIQDFCLENEVDSARALQVGICAEELITNVINYGYNKDVLQYIDVNVRIIENEVILRVRDDGITFNPVEYHTEEMSFSGIETVKKLAKSLNYSRVLGFNSSIIKV
jgi:two-component sensor histidine kinase